MRSIAARSVGALPLLLLLVLSTGTRAEAQRLGLEVGLAGVGNYDGISPSVGVSLFLPITGQLRGVVAAAQWTGCDQSITAGCDEPRAGYGNRSLNLLALYRIVGSRAASASLGAGLGWFEMLRVRNGDEDSYYQEALTLSGELRRAVAFNSSAYLRGDLSFPTDDNQPRWGTLRVGVDVGGLF